MSEGGSYFALLTQVRRELLVQQGVGAKASAGELARELGFSGPSALGRWRKAVEGQAWKALSLGSGRTYWRDGDRYRFLVALEVPKRSTASPTRRTR
jgi:hypothetical protein